VVRTPTLAAMLALVFAVLFTGPFAAPAEAQDKSFSLPRAQVVADVQPDGSVLVTEQITYDFIGSFEGGYREIPLKDGMSVTDVSVSEVGRAYAPGASAELGSSGAPGTYGTADLGYAYRIVWHYRASYEERTFTVRYRLNGLAVAHDDVVDVYWQVWGDEWQEPLGSLEATMALPGDASKGEVKVFGHPASVSGKTSLGPDGIPPDGIPPDGISPDRVSPTLVASDVPAGQFVEMRVVFPRELLSSTGGARVEPGDGLQEIMDEEAAEARSEARRAWLMRLQPLFGLLLVVVSVGAMAFVYLRYGREPKVDYAERYEREPPTNDPPAVIGAIISQKPSVGSREFTATLFDLIRRGVLKAQPVSVKEGGFWGDKTMTDLRVDVGSSDPGSIEDFARNVLTLENFERRVLNVAERVLSHGALNLTDFQESIKDGDDRQANRSSYESFRNAVKREVERRDLVERSPGMWLGWAAILLGLAGAAWFVLSLLGVDAGVLISLIFSNLLAFAIVVVVFWVVFRRGTGKAGSAVGLALLHQMWVRRTRKGALLHARWQAFRRYLSDFSRMEESPPASLALWEQFLVYGIALGVAEQVLEAARLHAPPEVAQGGTFYSPGIIGSISGPYVFSFSNLENDFSEAFTPLSSSGSGGGGWFSGGGGGGFGGGGGGAW
jgi:uncharacterized membrane protein